jgi:hypothetical protein
MKGDIIPNEEKLYRYVNPKVFPDDQDEIPTSIFIDKNLSCDWEKYQPTPEKSYHIGEGKNMIIRINVCDEIKQPSNPKRLNIVMADWLQNVIHDPIAIGDDVTHPDIENESHSLIQGLKKFHIVAAIRDNSEKYKLVELV